MFTVTNVSDETRRFNIRLPDGQMKIARLAPRESGDFDCDENQAVFVRGFLKARKTGAKTKADTPADPS